MNSTKQDKINWGVGVIFILFGLTILTVIIRIITGKYDEGFAYIFAWIFAALALPTYVTFNHKRFESTFRLKSLIFYYSLVFINSLLFQPLLWTFGQLGFISFYSYSLIFILPLQGLIVYPFLFYKESVSENEATSNFAKDKKQTARLNLNLKNQELKPFDEKVVDEAKEEVKNNKIAKALNLLMDNCQDREAERKLTILKQQWVDFESRRKMGVLTEESSRVTMLSILNGILSVMNDHKNGT